MRIAFVTPEFVTDNYFSGGLANYVHRASKALAGLGHDVHVFSFASGHAEPYEHDGVTVHPVSSNRMQGRLRRLTGGRCGQTIQWFAFSFEAWRALRRRHKEKPFDILQVPNSRACGLFCGLLSKVPSATRISCYRPAWNEAAGLARDLDARLTEWLEWLHLRLSRHVYGPSEVLQKMLHEEAGITRIKVIRTPFYLETVEWDRSLYDAQLKGKRYLLFVGRYQLHKGIHILAQALPRILETLTNCHAVFVGMDAGSPLSPSMQEYTRSLNQQFGERLTFIGQSPHNQLYPIMEGAHLVVLPSLVDNLPNTMLESMSLAKPVVGTIGASFDEVIEDGKNGFLVPVGDAAALANKVIEAWNHPHLEEIGAAAQRTMERFSPERTIQELLAYFEEVRRRS